MDMAPVDRVRVADHGDGAQLSHGAPGLHDRARDVVERDLRGELQAAVDGDVSRKMLNLSLGASYSLFSMP